MNQRPHYARIKVSKITDLEKESFEGDCSKLVIELFKGVPLSTKLLPTDKGKSVWVNQFVDFFSLRL